MNGTKKSRPLPSRGGLNDFTAKVKSPGGVDLRDYSKLTQVDTPTAQPAAILNLVKPRRGG